MTRFFFDFRQGEQRCPDAEGIELGSVEQAYLEAFKGAQDMWSELLRERRDPRRCRFEVRNGQRELLFVLPFQEVIDSCQDRVAPPSRGTFENITDLANHTNRVSAEFIRELHSVRATLAESRALLRAKV